jgi:hypothetical protein
MSTQDININLLRHNDGLCPRNVREVIPKQKCVNAVNGLSMCERRIIVKPFNLHQSIMQNS